MHEEGKIHTLNRSVAAMLNAFASEDTVRGEIHVGVVTFGGDGAHLHQPLVPIRQAGWQDMAAGGPTPMGDAFDLARELLEDPEVVTGRSFHPTIVLLSDGRPTPPGSWREPLNRLLESDRARTAVRIAVGIGTDRTPEAEEVLAAFCSTGERVRRADEVEDIAGFFRWLTLSVTEQLHGGRPRARLEDLDAL